MIYRKTTVQTCQNKVAYKTARKAKRAARHLPGWQWPYKCNICGKFHLTSGCQTRSVDVKPTVQ